MLKITDRDQRDALKSLKDTGVIDVDGELKNLADTDTNDTLVARLQRLSTGKQSVFLFAVAHWIRLLKSELVGARNEAKLESQRAGHARAESNATHERLAETETKLVNALTDVAALKSTKVNPVCGRATLEAAGVLAAERLTDKGLGRKTAPRDLHDTMRALDPAALCSWIEALQAALDESTWRANVSQPAGTAPSVDEAQVELRVKARLFDQMFGATTAESAKRLALPGHMVRELYSFNKAPCPGCSACNPLGAR